MKAIYQRSGSVAVLAALAFQPCMAQEASDDSQHSAVQTAGTSTAATSSTSVMQSPAATGKTREEVQQELIQFKKSGDTDRIQELYRGN